MYEGNFSAHALTLVGQLKLLLNHMSEKFSSGMKNHKQTNIEKMMLLPFTNADVQN